MNTNVYKEETNMTIIKYPFYVLVDDATSKLTIEHGSKDDYPRLQVHQLTRWWKKQAQ